MKLQSPRSVRTFLVLLGALATLWHGRCAAAGYALQFTNGINQSVNVLFVPELNMYPFTVTAWIKAGAQPSDPMFQPTPILSKGNTFDGWNVSIYNGDIRATYVVNPNYVSDGPPLSNSGLNGGAVGDNQWHHVAFTVDASGGKIYVDGVLRTNKAWVGVPATNQLVQPILFGRGQSSSAQYVGMLDEVTLWNTALTQAQIQTNKNRLLTGLEPGLIAYYRLDESGGLHSLDSAPAGGTNTGSWNNVTPVLSDSPIARLPAVYTLLASAVGGTTATLNGLANPQGTNTSAWFEWGATTNYGNTTPAMMLPALTNNLPFPQGITGLTPGTTYHFRGVASNTFGMAWGTNVSFTTLSGPVVVTLPASAVVASNATLNGAINPNGTTGSTWFEWGVTTNYGNTTVTQAVDASMSLTNFSQILSGLEAGTTIHFRAAASNNFAVVRGTNQSFVVPMFWLVTNLTQAVGGAVAWVDYDGDGQLDAMASGLSTNGNISVDLWRNTTGGFAKINVPFLGGFHSAFAWGDYDNDGRPDLALSGRTNGGVDFITAVWRNTAGGFTNLNVPFPKVLNGTMAWGDYDNDGRLDLILTGDNVETGPLIGIAELWRNTGGGFSKTSLALPLLGASEGAFVDYDKDGRVDILGMGFANATATNVNFLAHNECAEGITFFTTITNPFTRVYAMGLDWGDYDNDGRLDLLFSGTTNSVDGPRPVVQLWRNTTNGFVKIPVSLRDVAGSVRWGDYDNDGRLDILMSGASWESNVCEVWRNIGTGFTNISAGFPVMGGDVVWGDYDNDGRLDVLVNANGFTQIWKNKSPVANTPPTAPTGLSVTGVGSVVTLSWNAAADAQTPATGLSYNVRIGTTPGGSDVVGPMALANGFRSVPRRGNAEARTFFRFNYTPGVAYYWSVQAIDTAFAGGPFAAEGSFKILSPAFSIVQPHVTNLLAGDANGDGVVSQSELDTVYANYLPTSPWLYMTNVAGLGGTDVTFALTNSLAGSYSVEYTTNLANWQYLGPATPRYLFTDTNAPAAPQRSYRLRSP